jgi:phenylacetic acid degradation operon negative regulatory protein
MQSRNIVILPDAAPESASDLLIHLPPMTARSVLASALLGEDPPELPVAHLVLLGELFGINPNRSRVALSRMVARGTAWPDGPEGGKDGGGWWW